MGTDGNGASNGELEQKLVDYIQDAYAMERDVEQMLGTMISTTDDDTVRGMLEHHREETKQQLERLEGCLDAHDASPSTRKNVQTLMAAMGKGVVDHVRGDKAGKNARDGYTTEAMEIAAYELLERLAVRAGDQQTADVARRNRAEEEAMRDKIEANWDRFLELTLEENEITARA